MSVSFGKIGTFYRFEPTIRMRNARTRSFLPVAPAARVPCVGPPAAVWPAHFPAPCGFTLPEALVVIAVLGIAAAFLVPVLARARSASRSVNCLANLHQVSLAFHLYASDNSSIMPDPGATQISWQRSLRPYLPSSSAFVCPADNEISPSTGLSSYDWRDTGKPESTLAGRSLSEVGRSNAVLVFDALPQWHEKHRINIARVDGSTGAVDQAACFKDLDSTISR